jgi:DNA repair protein RecO (recombination protein O)
LLGFAPNVENYKQKTFFDLKNGAICEANPLHQFFLSQEETEIFVQLLRFNFSTMHLLKLSRLQRQQILEQMLLFYRLHLPNFSVVKSLDVLKQIFN